MCDPLDRHAFVIHGVDHARAVLTAVAGTGLPVALWSAPGAAAYMGAPMFREIINAATAEFPGIDAIGVLDCGQDAGFALAAFRHGVGFVRVDLPSATLARVADIARQMGATVVRDWPPALDLIDCPEPVSACRTWLSQSGR
jgi:fructose/tagatose bisphosphate aldolase